MTTEQQSDESQEQALRSDCYLFLAGLLNEAPAEAQLSALASVQTDETSEGALADAWQQITLAARAAKPQLLSDEYFKLFVGLGRGELVPFGSWYITGFLQERPLAELRDTLNQLGLAPVEGGMYTEDHMAQELAVMATLISNSDNYSFDQQRAFYEQHLAPWAKRFFGDLVEAKSADFYQSIGRLGLAFIAFESEYLNMPS